MRNYRLERFCISGAGIKLTELVPNILRIEAKETRQGCTVWVTDGFGNLGIEHAEMPCPRFIWPHLKTGPAGLRIPLLYEWSIALLHCTPGARDTRHTDPRPAPGGGRERNKGQPLEQASSPAVPCRSSIQGKEQFPSSWTRIHTCIVLQEGERRDSQARDLPFKEVERDEALQLKQASHTAAVGQTLRTSHDSEYG